MTDPRSCCASRPAIHHGHMHTVKRRVAATQCRGSQALWGRRSHVLRAMSRSCFQARTRTAARPHSVHTNRALSKMSSVAEATAASRRRGNSTTSPSKMAPCFHFPSARDATARPPLASPRSTPSTLLIHAIGQMMEHEPQGRYATIAAATLGKSSASAMPPATLRITPGVGPCVFRRHVHVGCCVLNDVMPWVTFPKEVVFACLRVRRAVSGCSIGVEPVCYWQFIGQARASWRLRCGTNCGAWSPSRWN